MGLMRLIDFGGRKGGFEENGFVGNQEIEGRIKG
jgi:hypothetical protein